MSKASAAPLEAGIALEAPTRRRQLGLLLLALGVGLVAGQSFFEWQIPYDVMALQRVQSALGLPHLMPQGLSTTWGLVCAVGLVALLATGPSSPGAPWLALATGVALGSARLAAGGPFPAVLVLLLAGVASLGWQSWRHGGLAMLAGTGLAIVAWDEALSSYATLWPVCLALAGMFVWIERKHIQATDQRLIAALTEREALIRDLNTNRDQLTLLQQARTQLLASISHDLRQPLQAVRLYAEALLARKPSAETASLVERQLRAADDAVGMLDQFSEFSAIEQGALTSQPSLVELRAILDRLGEALRATLAGADIDIRVHGRKAWAWVDRSQFLRIVQNLAGNAVRYSVRAEGGRRARVVLAVRPHGDALAIDIVDNGLGIPGDKLDLVFEPYVQLHQAPGTRGGRGLGLAIVRGLAHQLGLELAPIRSVVDRGTRFRVIVPAALRRDAPADLAANGGSTGEPQLRWLAGRMLAVLDDEDAPRDALAVALRSAEAHVVEAADFATLVARLDEEVRFPDALVFDLDLRSDIDGVQAIRRLRESWQEQVPAVIVTGRVAPERGIDLPAGCGLLAKPVSLTQLVELLAPLVEAAEAREA